MPSDWSQDAYTAALRYAAHAHQGQRVPGTDLPYVVHAAVVAMVGHTSEDVDAGIKEGTFGMASETGNVLNEAIADGAKKGLGLGQSVGARLLNECFPYKEFSLLARACELGIPVTVHGEEAIPEQIEAQDELNETQKASCAELEEELGAAQQEANDYKDKYLRAQAEMANLKKRLERRYEEQVEEEKKLLLLKFLSVADNLERALNHADLNEDGLRDGIQLTYQEFQNLLAQEGVEQMAPKGQPFDSSYHEAVAIIPTSEAETDTVIAEIQKGYLYQDQLLRPARVHVAGTLNHE